MVPCCVSTTKLLIIFIRCQHNAILFHAPATLLYNNVVFDSKSVFNQCFECRTQGGVFGHGIVGVHVAYYTVGVGDIYSRDY